MLKKSEYATNDISKLSSKIKIDQTPKGQRQQLMKNLKVLVVAVLLVMLSNAVNAQTKIGYISVDNVVMLMPATAKIDSILEKFKVDSIQPEYTRLITQYQWKDSVYRDTVKTPKSVRDEVAKELPSYIYQIQNWQQIEGQIIENKQNQLLAPIYKDVYEAIKAVAKEKGYTHVVSREALIVMPDGDNMLQAVATKLKLKLPPNAPTGARP